MHFLRKLFGSTGSIESTLSLHNTLTDSLESFSLPSWARNTVRMYNCGPTVYGRQHIGNLSMFVFTDVLRRTLEYNGYTVKQVINFTDVGHLTSDADEGDDKMVRGLKADGLKPTLENMKELGKKYANLFREDITALNIKTKGTQFPFASEHIADDIALVQTLEEKGYTYTTKNGVYFDTSRFPRYGKLGNIDLSGLKEGARVATDPEKRNPTDFNLWKLSKKLGWESPWGKGFPGWHIECSAMVHRLLGNTIDIHTGGIEHIPVHHNNEIAQTEAATGKPLARFWLHRAHLQMGGQKLAKSENRVVYLSDILEKGFHPLAFRYLLLGAHYRTPANFTWEAVSAAQNALTRLQTVAQGNELGTVASGYASEFLARINDDLDTPGALAVVWNMIKDGSLSPADKRATLLRFDHVLGLSLDTLETFVAQEIAIEALPTEVKKAVQEREEARKRKDWEHADTLRGVTGEAGYSIEDTPNGPRIFKMGPDGPKQSDDNKND